MLKSPNRGKNFNLEFSILYPQYNKKVGRKYNLILISKDNAKKIRKLNKQKGRSEHAGLICGGNGRVTVQDYYNLSFYDRNLVKIIKQFENTPKNEKKWFELKKQIKASIDQGFKNLNADILTLEAMIDVYGCLHARLEQVDTLKGQLDSRQKSLQECINCKNEYEKIIKSEVN